MSNRAMNPDAVIFNPAMRPHTVDENAFANVDKNAPDDVDENAPDDVNENAPDDVYETEHDDNDVDDDEEFFAHLDTDGLEIAYEMIESKNHIIGRFDADNNLILGTYTIDGEFIQNTFTDTEASANEMSGIVTLTHRDAQRDALGDRETYIQPPGSDTICSQFYGAFGELNAMSMKDPKYKELLLLCESLLLELMALDMKTYETLVTEVEMSRGTKLCPQWSRGTCSLTVMCPYRHCLTAIESPAYCSSFLYTHHCKYGDECYKPHLVDSEYGLVAAVDVFSPELLIEKNIPESKETNSSASKASSKREPSSSTVVSDITDDGNSSILLSQPTTGSSNFDAKAEEFISSPSVTKALGESCSIENLLDILDSEEDDFSDLAKSFNALDKIKLKALRKLRLSQPAAIETKSSALAPAPQQIGGGGAVMPATRGAKPKDPNLPHIPCAFGLHCKFREGNPDGNAVTCKRNHPPAQQPQATAQVQAPPQTPKKRR